MNQETKALFYSLVSDNRVVITHNRYHLGLYFVLVLFNRKFFSIMIVALTIDKYFNAVRHQSVTYREKTPSLSLGAVTISQSFKLVTAQKLQRFTASF